MQRNSQKKAKKQRKKGTNNKWEKKENKQQDDRLKHNHVDNIIKWKWHKVANKNTEIISLDKSETLLYYVNKNTILNIKSQVKNKRMEKINMSTLIIKQLEWL